MATKLTKEQVAAIAVCRLEGMTSKQAKAEVRLRVILQLPLADALEAMIPFLRRNPEAYTLNTFAKWAYDNTDSILRHGGAGTTAEEGPYDRFQY